MTLDDLAFKRIRAMIPDRPDLTRDLQFMARYKYDSYEVYSGGKRFLPSLLDWLSQFESKAEQETGLILVRNLLFLSRREVLELVSVTYQRILQEILDEVTRNEKLKPFDYSEAYRRLPRFLSNCVFVGMSDGAQIDYFRRHSKGTISNEQVVPYYKADRAEIRKHSQAKYAFLIDDMCGSGTTFLRLENRKREHVVDGQLVRFLDIWGKLAKFDAVFYCPYVITEKAQKRLERLVSGSNRIMNNQPKFRFEILCGMSIPETYSILKDDNRLFSRASERKRVVKLCGKYYHSKVEDEHTRKGGGCRYGFGRTGILLVRYGNTPNNTPSIVWYTGPYEKPKGLFTRLARHYQK